MRFFSGPPLLLLAALALTASCARSPGVSSDDLATPGPVRYLRDVHPLLATSCAQCHGGEKSENGFSIETRESIIAGGWTSLGVVVGKSEESYLIELVTKEEMPKEGPKLTEAQIGVLRRWIDEGLEWETTPEPTPGPIAPLALTRPDPPKRRWWQRRLSNPIDRFLRPYYKQNGVKRGRVVDDRTFARRATIDLTGLLPPPERLESFVADRSKNKRELFIEDLLARDGAYAEHWMTFWSDMLRNDFAGTGYIDGGRKQITGWLYAALAGNKPYDDFVRELIDAEPEAEGFIRGIKWRGTTNASQTTSMQAAQNVSQVFMGTNLKCASCHDSFINRWKLKDSYALAAAFADGPLQIVRCDATTGEMAKPGFLFPALGSIDADAPRKERLAQLARLTTSNANGRLARTVVNRLWKVFFGRGLIEPVDDMDAEPWRPELLDWLAADLVDRDYDLRHTMGLMLTSLAYRRPAVTANDDAAEAFVFRGPLVRRMQAEQFLDAISCVTGVWQKNLGVRGELAGRIADEGGPGPRAWMAKPTPFMRVLGRPNREQVVTVRFSQATTLQAMEAMNGADLTGIVESGADRVLAEGWSEPGPLIEEIFIRALARRPSAEERELATSVLGPAPAREGVQDLLWMVFNTPEFQLIY